MSSDVILHIGTMKTGTTSIQTSLTKNTSNLERAGIYYARGSHRAVSEFEASAQVAKQKHCSLLISDEGIWHFLISPTKREYLVEIEKLFSKFLGRDGKLKIVIYLRRPDEFLQSWYFQGLKFGTGNPIFAEFKAAPFVQSGLSFLSKLKLIENIFPQAQLIVRPYEKTQLKNASSIDDFYASIGFKDTEALVDVPTRNVSEKRVDYYLKRAMLLAAAKKLDLDPTSEEILQRIRQAETGYNTQEQQSAKLNSIWSDKETAALYAHYIPIFEIIASNYAPDSPAQFFEQWQPKANSDSLPPILKAFLELKSISDF